MIPLAVTARTCENAEGDAGEPTLCQPKAPLGQARGCGKSFPHSGSESGLLGPAVVRSPKIAKFANLLKTSEMASHKGGDGVAEVWQTACFPHGEGVYAPRKQECPPKRV